MLKSGSQASLAAVGSSSTICTKVDEILVHVHVIFFIQFITRFTDIVYLNFQKYILVAQE